MVWRHLWTTPDLEKMEGIYFQMCQNEMAEIFKIPIYRSKTTYYDVTGFEWRHWAKQIIAAINLQTRCQFHQRATSNFCASKFISFLPSFSIEVEHIF